MAFMRAPSRKLPADIRASWSEIVAVANDPRLCKEQFQLGHMIGIYWDTVARWMTLRAKRDAEALQTLLFIVQSADSSSPPMPVQMAAKLMSKANPKHTGGMHGFQPVHEGMKVRLLKRSALTAGW